MTSAHRNGRWLGVDMQPGDGVDEVLDVCGGIVPDQHKLAFTGIVCSEVLEHVKDPLLALANINQMLEPGGYLLVTTLTAFPIHGFPDDYWRFTPSGLGLLLDRAGFPTVEVSGAGGVDFRLNDHGEPGITRKTCPMHVCRRWHRRAGSSMLTPAHHHRGHAPKPGPCAAPTWPRKTGRARSDG